MVNRGMSPVCTVCLFVWFVVYQAPLQEGGVPVFLIGGAEKAAELDAKRAIDQGTRLAAVVENAKTGEVFNAPETLKAKVREENSIEGKCYYFTTSAAILLYMLSSF